MNNNIQCSIESSTTKIELNSAADGVFLVPELEGLVGLPEIRTTSGVNAGYDGGWTSAQNYDARLISIRGVIANPDISKVEDKRRAIASLLGQGRKEQLTLRFTTEAGNAYAISVRTISCEMALQRVLTTQEFLIQLRADDPLIYDDGTTGGIAAILQPQRALGGFEINFGLPLAIGGGAEDTVVDNGNETVYPVIKLYGALHSPTVVNRTTNQQMQILADLQYSIDWHTYRSATGDYILVNDGLDGAPMTLSQLLGNAEQTTYSGKNLLNIDFTSTTTMGITITNNGDGTITVSGTTTGAVGYNLSPSATNQQNPLTLAPNTAYTQRLEILSGSASNFSIVPAFKDSGGTVRYNFFSNNQTTTTTDTMTCSYYNIYWGAAGRVINATFRVWLEKGSDLASPYEPYVGGTPAPNPQFPMPISTVVGAQNIEVVGKNLFDKDSATQNYRLGSTGDPFADGAYYLSDYISVRQSTAYYISGVSGNAESSAVCFYASDKSFISRRAFVSDWYSFTTPANTAFLRFTTQKTHSIDQVQLEKGSTATAYEPYHGQSYEVNLGKNLLDNKATTRTYLGVTLTKNNDGSITLNGTSTGNAQFYLDVDGVGFQGRTSHLDAGTYTINGRDSGGVKFEINYKSTNGGVLYSWGTFTVAEPFDYGVYVVVTNGTTVNNLRIYPQLERGSQATSYAPYFTPIELAKVGDYQDRIYKDDGKWYIKKQIGKVVFDGSESWFFNDSGTNTNRFAVSAASYGLASGAQGLCNNNEFVASGVSVDSQRVGIVSSTLYYRINKTTLASTSANDFKTWLASNNTIVYTALATPTTTEITDETLLSQLNFLASLYEGENNISLVGTGAQGEMVIRYATDHTVNQDVITIDSQARTITLNGQDVYHLKTSESEFLVLAPGENKLYLTSEVSDDSGYAEVKFKQGYLSI